MKTRHVFHRKHQKEFLLWEQLCLHGIEACYPHIRVQSINPRARKSKPYFPGYLFARVELIQGRQLSVEMPVGQIDLIQRFQS
jgi:hypothetical protein